jgi:hypothetical protein
MFNVGKSIAKITGRTGLRISKHSPEILMGMGIFGGVTAAILACKATADPRRIKIISGYRQQMLDIQMMADAAKNGETRGDHPVIFTKQEQITAKFDAMRQYATFMGRLYGPSIGLGIASIGCILGGHHILKSRNVALIAAYKAVDSAFKEYRERVKETYGLPADMQLMYPSEERSFTQVEMLEDGTTKTSEVTWQVLKGEKVSIYGKIFDQDTSTQWVKNADFNWLFLKKKRDYLNDRLHSVGHVFLNEVYDELGIQHTQAGQIVGWVSNGCGDGYISFGPWCESLDEMIEVGPNGVLLDFNVDGIIWDLI